uniref:5-deoxy-glucuronate isomerase n=1 Tax=Dongia rigui TaxID=940149 RepID=UPI003899239A
MAQRDLLVKSKAPDAQGRVHHITPQSAGWGHVGFDLYHLKSGQKIDVAADAREHCLVLVAGRADVAAGNETFRNIGERNSPFEGKAPYSVYAPAGIPCHVTALSDVELAVCSAPGGKGSSPIRLIAPKDVAYEERGKGSNVRHVYNILPETAPADGLLVVEVVTPGGNWSSYPPHKHDTSAAPVETKLEETYYHRLNPSQGFAFQRVYTDDRSIDQTMAVENGDVVMVPEGYHPVGAPHGYDLYYLNVMAGPERRWCFKNDPQHEWIVKK